MPGRQRKPIGLIESEGKSHLTKAQIDKRKKEELVMPQSRLITPSYLTDIQKKEFKTIVKQLKKINETNQKAGGSTVFSDLDVDMIAAYVISHQEYLKLTDELSCATEVGARKTIQLMQSRALKDAHMCATSLGLTVTGRAKIVIPKVDDDDDAEF